MTADPGLDAFLVLSDAAVADWAWARAAALDLPLPDAVRTGVVDNLVLLRAQAAAFLAGLPADAPLAETFEP